MNELFCLRLRQLRRSAYETQEELSAFLGVNRATVSGYERDILMPPFDKIEKIANHYGVSVAYLTGTTNDKTEGIKSQEQIELYEMTNDFTPEELKELMEYGRFIISKRNK